MTSGLTAATTTGTGGSTRPLTQVLSDFLGTLRILLATEVTAANQAEHNAEVTKVRDQIAKAQDDLNVENVRMVMERAWLDVVPHRVRAEILCLSLNQDASNAVFRRIHQTSLP